MTTKRLRWAEAKLIWNTGRVEHLCPVSVALFIAVNAVSLNPKVRITSHKYER